MKNLAYLLVCLVFFPACQKENNPGHSPPACPSTDVKKITDPKMKMSRFLEGSRWVFTDSLKPGGLDSIEIRSVVVRNEEPGPLFRCMFIEQHETEFDWQGVPELLYRKYHVWPDCCYVFDTRGFRVIYLAADPRPRFTVFDSLLVNGKFYRNVMKSDTIRLPEQNNQPELRSLCLICYFCPDAGFVRFDVYQHGKFLYCKRLLRYNIKR